jgi:hypothetical protein
MILRLLSFILVPLLDSSIQGWFYKHRTGFGYHPERGRDPFYFVLNIIRGIAMILHGAFAVDAQPGMFIPLFCWYTGVYGIEFDPLLNWFRKKRFAYEGQNSGMMKNLYYWQQALAGAALIIFSLWFFTTQL